MVGGKEGYQPSEEDIKDAEDHMTKKEEAMSKERESSGETDQAFKTSLFNQTMEYVFGPDYANIFSKVIPAGQEKEPQLSVKLSEAEINWIIPELDAEVDRLERQIMEVDQDPNHIHRADQFIEDLRLCSDLKEKLERQ